MAKHRHDVECGPRDRRPTVAICATCSKIAIRGGPIVPDREFIASVGQCSFGDGWSWCETAQTYRVD